MEKIDYLLDKTNVIFNEIDSLEKADENLQTNIENVSTLAETNQSNITTLQTNQTKIFNNISNPNLLINGDFKINQRGKTSYTGTNAVKYTVDRWAINWSPNVSFNAQTKTLSFTGNGSFVQYIEESSSLLGKPVTLSAKINNSFYSATVTLQSSYAETSTPITIEIENGRLSLIYDKNKDLLYVSIGNSSGNSFDFVLDYVKLEIGSIATLFNISQSADELLKCQRYYEKANTSSAANKYSIYKYARNQWVFYDPFVSFKTTKRVRPTVTVYSSSTDTSGNLYNGTKAQDNQITLAYITTEGFIVRDDSASMAANNSVFGYFDADAEIY